MRGSVLADDCQDQEQTNYTPLLIRATLSGSLEIICLDAINLYLTLLINSQAAHRWCARDTLGPHMTQPGPCQTGYQSVFDSLAQGPLVY